MQIGWILQRSKVSAALSRNLGWNQEHVRMLRWKEVEIQTDEQLLANRPEIVMVDKGQKMAVVIDLATPAGKEEGAWEDQELPGAEGLFGTSEKQSSPSGESMKGSDPKLGEWPQNIQDSS